VNYLKFKRKHGVVKYRGSCEQCVVQKCLMTKAIMWTTSRNRPIVAIVAITWSRPCAHRQTLCCEQWLGIYCH